MTGSPGSGSQIFDAVTNLDEPKIDVCLGDSMVRITHPSCRLKFYFQVAERCLYSYMLRHYDIEELIAIRKLGRMADRLRAD